MGVWIETEIRTAFSMMLNVTPCMGVWIVTRKTTRAFNLPTSHPVWVCGLKLVLDS